jgi:hypothetical protein
MPIFFTLSYNVREGTPYFREACNADMPETSKSQLTILGSRFSPILLEMLAFFLKKTSYNNFYAYICSCKLSTSILGENSSSWRVSDLYFRRFSPILCEIFAFFLKKSHIFLPKSPNISNCSQIGNFSPLNFYYLKIITIILFTNDVCMV